jgi:hypothetical protein
MIVKNPRDRALGDDWADAAAALDSAIVVRPLRPTSIKLEPELIALLRQKGKRRGLPYQTMLKVILKENIDRY